MISNEEKELVSSCCKKKKLPLILRRITSKDNSDFYFLNCLHSFATTKKFESHETIYK